MVELTKTYKKEFEAVLNDGKDLDVSKISGCPFQSLNDCAAYCGRYCSCDTVAMAEDILKEYEQQPKYLVRHSRSDGRSEFFYAANSDSNAWDKAKELAFKTLWELCKMSRSENGLSFDYAKRRITLHLSENSYIYYDVVKRQKGEYLFDDYREF